MVKKISIILLYIAIAYLLFLYGETILTWLKTTNRIGLVTLIAIVMALFPIIPYPLVGGVIGAAFGSISGAFITWIGSSVASILMFSFIRYGYTDWGRKILHKNKWVSKITSLFEQNAFLAILFLRLLPMIPSIMINVYSALSRVSFLTYAISSTLGKIPAMILFAVVGDSILNEPRGTFYVMLIYGVFLLVTLSVYRVWKKGK